MRRYIALIGLSLLLLVIAGRMYAATGDAHPTQATVMPTLLAPTATAMPSPAAHLLLDSTGANLAVVNSPVPAAQPAGKTARRTPNATPAAVIEETLPAPTAAPVRGTAPVETDVEPTPAPPAPPSAPPTATAAPAVPAVFPTVLPIQQPITVPLLHERAAPPDRLIAAAIGLDTQVIPVGWIEVPQADGSNRKEWEVASRVAGWHNTSARPGESGNVVIAGHSNIEGEVFLRLGELEAGNEIRLQTRDREFVYQVTNKFTVAEKDVPYEQRLENARWIGRFPEERLTLFSCWPPNNNTHRIFIIAKPMS